MTSSCDSLPGQDPQQIVWGQVQASGGFHVMAYDVQHTLEWRRGENEFYFALRSADADEITRYWDALTDGASILVPLGPSVFSPLYGKLTDRFGVTWIIDVVVPYEP
ncbi:VOC family protein [Pseudonocardia sp. ICBG1293]|uniref:VOC family protein n=1 Tax=Pseudonocardia sp. ICBG1293 TaxID=2844382 RepID=UPI001CCAB111|nr:VOC family protein [Pseudonocardia sp. ICBG1293]